MEARPDLERTLDGLPLEPLLQALGELDAYAVGGWVRELVAGREPGGDLDVAVDGELDELLDLLDPDLGIVVHERHRRFGTATVELGGLRVDLTRTRSESYPRPGALPEVEPAPIEADLARRDFTVNAIAVALRPPHEMLDPFDGCADVDAGILRVLHDASFVDDPTRAIRAARYCVRLGVDPEPQTHALLRETDLGTVSADRRRAELARLAAEEAAPGGFRVLADWGLVDLDLERLNLLQAVDDAANLEPWAGDEATRSSAILLVAEGGERLDEALRLALTEPERPSDGVRLAAGHRPEELLVAAAAGCAWLTDYMTSWRVVGLEIDGEDLIAAGVPEGPGVGAGLRGALERKLDGALSGGREAELDLAIELARKAS